MGGTAGPAGGYPRYSAGQAKIFADNDGRREAAGLASGNPGCT